MYKKGNNFTTKRYTKTDSGKISKSKNKEVILKNKTEFKPKDSSRKRIKTTTTKYEKNPFKPKEIHNENLDNNYPKEKKFERKNSFLPNDNYVKRKKPFGDVRGKTKEYTKKENIYKSDDNKRRFKKGEKYNTIDSSKKYEKTYKRETVIDIRLNKFLANAGVAARREADDLIKSGCVSVNGKVITTLGTKIKPNDEVRFNGTLIRQEPMVYYVMNKPKDYITTTKDSHNRKTVLDLIYEKTRQRIYPIGRLDRNTTGVLLFTNDGDLAQKLTHPKYGISKVYSATLDKSLKKTDLIQLTKGVELEDGLSVFDKVAYIDETDKTKIGIELHSGKNRVVRRTFEKLGYEVLKLDRTSFGSITKRKLEKGEVRPLTEKEIIELKKIK